jgi:two-component system LytT family response regulator
MNDRIKALIVDDEPRAQSILLGMLAENCPFVEVIDTVGNVPQAIKAIHTLQPDIIFLDIEMPGYSGFQLLEMIPDPQFQVIFTTAYSEYALKAFEVSAIDYLLKPIRIQKLIEAVQKAQRMLSSHDTAQRISTLQSNLSADVWQRLALPVSDGFVFLRFDEIEALEGEGSYTRIFKTDGGQMLVTRLLRDLEQQLIGTGNFLRCHRSHIVNMQYATKWQKSDGGSIVLQSGRQVPVNKESRDLLARLMS